MRRNGKIGRLPPPVREQLNRRLENGDDGADLLKWLNQLPEVKESLAQHFNGHPISKQNLSDWRQGAFHDWELRQDWIAHADELANTADEIRDATPDAQLADNLLTLVSARYAALLNGWDGAVTPEFEARVATLRGLAQDVIALQKTIYCARKEDLDFRAEVETPAQERLRESRALARELYLDPLEAAERAKRLGETGGGSPAARERARDCANLEYGLVDAEEGRKIYETRLKNPGSANVEVPAAADGRSNPVQASPAKSDYGDLSLDELEGIWRKGTAEVGKILTAIGSAGSFERVSQEVWHRFMKEWEGMVWAGCRFVAHVVPWEGATRECVAPWHLNDTTSPDLFKLVKVGIASIEQMKPAESPGNPVDLSMDRQRERAHHWEQGCRAASTLIIRYLKYVKQQPAPAPAISSVSDPSS
jgi:hypothetical protein